MEMKARTQQKPKGPARAKPQQVVYELKYRVVTALNRLSDRDTHQIGVEELEKTVESLTPEGIVPFMSCILDTDSEQKSAVRKECVRLMGMLVKLHQGLVAPHLVKMVASVVKRLKDPDTIVRDACVDTMGTFALNFGDNQRSMGIDVFVALVKPCFEALGEQNKQVQSGAALCLARVIDNISDPPVSILQRMLIRTNKLLKNPHFKAKSAVIELNRSIILVGGASSRGSLSSAIGGIQESLKCSDWTARKAASSALGEIAASGGSFFAPFKASCISSLELCRFDKIKPVRDAALQALSLWRNIPGSEGPELSDTESTKETSFGVDCCSSEVTHASSSLWKDASHRDSNRDLLKQRIASSVRNTSLNMSGIPNQSKSSDWPLDIAVPVSSKGVQHNEEACSSTTKIERTVSADDMNVSEGLDNYVYTYDKQECSSASSHFVDNFSNKFTATTHSYLGKGDAVNPMQLDTVRSSDNDFNGSKLYMSKTQDRRSIDSTITEDSHVAHVCCPRTKSEFVSIRKQLEGIEKKQASLMDLMQVFTGNTMECLHMLQSKILGLEQGISNIANGFSQGECTDLTSGECIQKSRHNSSPRLSVCTPRISLDQFTVVKDKSTKNWEGPDCSRVSSAFSSKSYPVQGTTSNREKNFLQRGQKNSKQEVSVGKIQPRKSNNIWQTGQVNMNNLWKRVTGFLCEGDLDSAYKEALCSGNESLLVELLNATGPVLESLSSKTISNLLVTLASYLVEKRFMNFVVPWLQQMVNLASTHGPDYVPLSAKAKQDLVCAVEESLNVEFSHPGQRRFIMQLAVKLQQLWGE